MRLAPSLLAADLADLAGAARTCAHAQIDLLHLDVMDAHFVPNLTFGPPVIQALAKHTTIPLDVHLMVAQPDEVVAPILASRPEFVSVHWEACRHLDRTLALIHQGGAKAGVALNPATPIEVLADIIPVVDLVVLMSVNPGFGGQRFLPYTLEKCRRLAAMRQARGLHFQIEMDGGLDLVTLGPALAAGVDIAVVGTGIFGAPDPLSRIAELRSLAL